MPRDNPVDQQPGGRSAPGVVAPTNRVNVAFPFSKISVEEPSEEMAELCAIVADLVAVVERSSPSPEVEALLGRARALVARMP